MSKWYVFILQIPPPDITLPFFGRHGPEKN